jgi:hypothetical protein
VGFKLKFDLSKQPAYRGKASTATQFACSRLPRLLCRCFSWLCLSFGMAALSELQTLVLRMAFR